MGKRTGSWLLCGEQQRQEPAGDGAAPVSADAIAGRGVRGAAGAGRVGAGRVPGHGRVPGQLLPAAQPAGAQTGPDPARAAGQAAGDPERCRARPGAGGGQPAGVPESVDLPDLGQGRTRTGSTARCPACTASPARPARPGNDAAWRRTRRRSNPSWWPPPAPGRARQRFRVLGGLARCPCGIGSGLRAGGGGFHSPVVFTGPPFFFFLDLPVTRHAASTDTPSAGRRFQPLAHIVPALTAAAPAPAGYLSLPFSSTASREPVRFPSPEAPRPLLGQLACQPRVLGLQRHRPTSRAPVVFDRDLRSRRYLCPAAAASRALAHSATSVW